MPAVCVPPNPGLLSALGLLAADLRHDLSAAILMAGDRPRPDRLVATFAELDAEAAARLEDDGIAPERWRLDRSLDVRYVGQEYALTVPTSTSEPLDDVFRRFHEQHERVYGHGAPEEPVEIVAARVTGWGGFPRLEVPESHVATTPQTRTTRDVWFAETRSFVAACVLPREALRPGDAVSGPAIIEQLDTTTVVPPGHLATVHERGSLLIRREAA